MAQPRLPQELIDEVIEYLWSDTTTLKACALTCTSSLHCSQRQLFSSISLSLPSSAETQKSLHTRRTFIDFKHILERSPHLASYVRRLELHGLDQCLDDVEPEFGQHGALIFCLSALRGIRALKLGCRPGVALASPKWDGFFHRELLPAMAETIGRSRVVSLDIDRFPLSAAILCPDVKHLALTVPDTRVSFDPATSVGIARHTIFPESLQLNLFEEQGSARNAVDWLLELDKSYINLNEVKTLHIGTDAVEWQETCAAWAILKACTATLETLSFDLQAPSVPSYTNNSFQSSHVLMDPLDWSSMKNMRRLHLRIAQTIAADQWGSRSFDSLPWISGLLKSLTASGKNDIEEVIIQANYQFMDDRCPHLVPWKDIVSQLCDRSRFPRIKNVRIMVASESKISSQCAAISRQISKYVRMHNSRRAIDIATSVSHQLYCGTIECQ